MVEFGSAGLRVFDLRDGKGIAAGRLPQEVAYFNSGGGYVHSGVFHYDAARGIVLASAADGMQVLELQPQVIRALGLPKPTDPAYPRYPDGKPAHPAGAPPVRPAPAPAAHHEGVLPD
jgi:hypothetical protein